MIDSTAGGDGGHDMRTAPTVGELQQQLAEWRRQGEEIAFVPTMGNLHEGHLSLLVRARQCAPRVVASIYVNPLQFGVNEDFASYPRTLADDSALLAEAGCDLLFTPSTQEIYPLGEALAARIEVPGLTDILCGEHRAGHFVGVATVVTKLLNMVRPDVAVFGEKDLQQLRIIERLVRDLHLYGRIVPAPTAREADGLAMSSRNRYLTAQERARASALYLALDGVASAIAAGEGAYGTLQAQAEERLRTAGLRPDYVSVRRRVDLQAPGPHDDQLVVLGAAWLGKARLIDNVAVTFTR